MKGAAYMETGRQLLVGVDLGRDFAQISYYDKKYMSLYRWGFLKEKTEFMRYPLHCL